MPDSQDIREADWRRRRNIATRWGGGSFGVGGVALLVYWLTMDRMPVDEDQSTGNIYRILNFGTRYSRGPTFKYGTHFELILVLWLTGLMIVGFSAAIIIYYIYNPGVIFRNALRHDD